MFQSFTHTLFARTVASAVIVAFVTMIPAQSGYAQVLAGMPVPGQMVQPTGAFDPALMLGLKVDLKDPFNFYFIMDKGEVLKNDADTRDEYQKLIKYFMASLTTPNDDMWVNLSPIESDRIIPDALATTDMGADMLAQDYLLKQFTASLMYPEDAIGQEFWRKIYEKAYDEYGTTDIPVDTFNKVWITADQADIYQKDDTAFLMNSHLKVMLEQDFMAMESNKAQFGNVAEASAETDGARKIASDIVREVIVPIIEKEVNEGRNFARVRQIYNSMILATWFKKTLKEGLLGQVYADKNKVMGVEGSDQAAKEKVYKQYLEAYKVGVFNYIKEESDPQTQEVIPRKYFSGGVLPVKPGTVQNIKLNKAQNLAQRNNWTEKILKNKFTTVVTTLAVTTVLGIMTLFAAPAQAGNTLPQQVADTLFANGNNITDTMNSTIRPDSIFFIPGISGLLPSAVMAANQADSNDQELNTSEASEEFAPSVIKSKESKPFSKSYPVNYGDGQVAEVSVRAQLDENGNSEVIGVTAPSLDIMNMLVASIEANGTVDQIAQVKAARDYFAKQTEVNKTTVVAENNTRTYTTTDGNGNVVAEVSLKVQPGAEGQPEVVNFNFSSMDGMGSVVKQAQQDVWDARNEAGREKDPDAKKVKKDKLKSLEVMHDFLKKKAYEYNKVVKNSKNLSELKKQLSVIVEDLQKMSADTSISGPKRDRDMNNKQIKIRYLKDKIKNAEERVGLGVVTQRIQTTLNEVKAGTNDVKGAAEKLGEASNMLSEAVIGLGENRDTNRVLTVIDQETKIVIANISKPKIAAKENTTNPAAITPAEDTATPADTTPAADTENVKPVVVNTSEIDGFLQKKQDGISNPWTSNHTMLLMAFILVGGAVYLLNKKKDEKPEKPGIEPKLSAKQQEDVKGLLRVNEMEEIPAALETLGNKAAAIEDQISEKRVRASDLHAQIGALVAAQEEDAKIKGARLMADELSRTYNPLDPQVDKKQEQLDELIRVMVSSEIAAMISHDPVSERSTYDNKTMRDERTVFWTNEVEKLNANTLKMKDAGNPDVWRQFFFLELANRHYSVAGIKETSELNKKEIAELGVQLDELNVELEILQADKEDLKLTRELVNEITSTPSGTGAEVLTAETAPEPETKGPEVLEAEASLGIQETPAEPAEMKEAILEAADALEGLNSIVTDELNISGLAPEGVSEVQKILSRYGSQIDQRGNVNTVSLALANTVLGNVIKQLENGISFVNEVAKEPGKEPAPELRKSIAVNLKAVYDQRVKYNDFALRSLKKQDPEAEVAPEKAANLYLLNMAYFLASFVKGDLDPLEIQKSFEALDKSFQGVSDANVELIIKEFLDQNVTDEELGLAAFEERLNKAKADRVKVDKLLNPSALEDQAPEEQGQPASAVMEPAVRTWSQSKFENIINLLKSSVENKATSILGKEVLADEDVAKLSSPYSGKFNPTVPEQEMLGDIEYLSGLTFDQRLGALQLAVEEYRESVNKKLKGSPGDTALEEDLARINAIMKGIQDNVDNAGSVINGGINLSDEHLTMTIKVDGAGMPLPAQFQDPAMTSIQGLSPIIREIRPLVPAMMPALAELLAP